MPTGPSAPEVWLLGSSDQSAILAAHFGVGFSFAHFINADGGAEVTRAYTQSFKPSAAMAEPHASVAVFVVCAPTESEAMRLAQSRDLFITRLYTGRLSRYPTVAEAEAYEYSPREWMIVEHARRRRVVGTPAQCRERLEALAEITASTSSSSSRSPRRGRHACAPTTCWRRRSSCPHAADRRTYSSRTHPIEQISRRGDAAAGVQGSRARHSW